MKNLRIFKGRNKALLLLPREKQLATFAALLCLMAMMPLTARAQTVYTTITSEQLTNSSTVYVGEVVVDGVSEIKYLYSGDVTLAGAVRQNLLDGLNGMADSDYATLLQANWPNNNPPEAFAFCSDATLSATMDGNWSSAQYVGSLYFSGKTITSEINSNLYDIDNGFKAFVDQQTEFRVENINNLIDVEKCIVSYLAVTETDNVYWIGNVKHVDTYVTYSSEATTVIYTKVELETPMTETPLTFEAVEAGTINIENPNGLTIEYNKNNTGWTSSSADPISIAVAANDVVAFRGNNSCYWASGDTGETPTRFTATNPCYVYGNVMSLVHDNDFATNYTLNDSEALAYLFAAPTNEQFMFYGYNTTLQNHPSKDIVLPATSVPDDGYMYMFAGCQGLTRAPQLPATTIGMGSYHQMFADCAGLVTAPEELPATILALSCYSSMFFGCSSLQEAPALPATTLADGCYMGMFEGCSSLETAPELPATTLSDWCYMSMFSGCTSLTTAPALPATTLAEDCYHRMFEGCTSLTKAPDLPAATLFGQVYGGMFDGCTSLNYVKCLATDLGENVGVYASVAEWLKDVSASGTFVKTQGMNDWPIGSFDGIPEGWTVESIEVFTTEGNWDVASNWSGNAVPADGNNVAIVANVTIPTGCTANAGNVSLYGSTLTIADDGQFIHSNAVNATLQKEITGFGNDNSVPTGWYTIASPLAEDFTPTNDMLTEVFDLYYYDEPNALWKNHKQNSFVIEPQKGYLYANSTDKTLAFTGEMQATDNMVEVSLSYEAEGDLKGYNLVGNPFTCNVTGDITLGGAALTSYYIADGSVTNEGANLIACNIVDRAIKPGEGFFVQATAANQDLVFNPAAKGEAATKPAFICIEAGNDSFMDRAYVQIGQGNTLRKMSLNDNTAKVYVMDDGKDYAAATIEAAVGEMPVHFKAAKNGTYTINVNVEHIDLAYLHLIDNLTGADVDLLENPSYTFTAKTTDYASRFRLVFSNSGDAVGDNDMPFAFINNGNIIVNGEGTLQVIDVMGRVVLSGDAINRVSTGGMAAGVYVLRLINGDDVKTQKMVVR